MAKSLLDRFEEKYIPEPNSGCWIWIGYIRKSDGYGEIQRGRRGLGAALAHRISYEMHIGPIPLDLELDHLCRVRCCVNPKHLEAVTRRINTMRGLNPSVQRARAAAITHCPSGHEYNDKNTYWAKTAKGYHNRMCRSCARIKAQQRRFECCAS